MVQVPDGTYRLILLTDATGNLTLANPLGQAIMVNGLRVPMPGGSPDTWQGNGVLGGVQGAGSGLGRAMALAAAEAGGLPGFADLDHAGARGTAGGVVRAGLEQGGAVGRAAGEVGGQARLAPGPRTEPVEGRRLAPKRRARSCPRGDRHRECAGFFPYVRG